MDKEKPNEPSTVDGILRKIEEKADTGEYLYRGEPEHYQEDPYYGKVSSNLYRVFLEHEAFDVEAARFNIEAVQASMLEETESYFRKPISELERLAEIQHYGGKTNLIDFTTDYLIALFFACSGSRSKTKDGRVILQEKSVIASDNIKVPYEPINRVIAQKSVFVRPPNGFIDPDEDDIINIPTELKHPMLTYLHRYHGISVKTIYNDLHGFIRNQDIHLEAYVEFYMS